MYPLGIRVSFELLQHGLLQAALPDPAEAKASLLLAPRHGFFGTRHPEGSEMAASASPVRPSLYAAEPGPFLVGQSPRVGLS